MCAKSIKIKIKKKLNKVFRNKNKIYSQYTTQLMKEKINFQKEEKKFNNKSMKMEMKLIWRCASLSLLAAFQSVFHNLNKLSSFNSSKFQIQIFKFFLFSLRIETLTCNKLSHCLFDFECPDFDEQYENEKY